MLNRKIVRVKNKSKNKIGEGRKKALYSMAGLIVVIMLALSSIPFLPSHEAIDTTFIETTWQKTTTADTLYESFDQYGVFDDDFEDMDLVEWSLSPSASYFQIDSTYTHTGSYGIKVNGGSSPIIAKGTFSVSGPAVIEVWIYDDLTTPLTAVVEYNWGTTDGSRQELGIDTGVFTGTYTYTKDINPPSYSTMVRVNTGIARTVGWHQTKAEVSALRTNFYIDGTFVGSTTYLTVSTLQNFGLAAGWGVSNPAYFDDVSVYHQEIPNWDILPGNHNWHVSGGVMIQDAYQYIPGSRIITGDSSWIDYNIQAKVKVEGSGPNRYGGILLRATDDAKNYYEIYLQDGGYLQFTKAFNGVRTWPMGAWTDMRVPVGNFYNEWWYVKGQVIGNVIRGKAWRVGDSEPGWHYSWIDSSSPLTSGKAGLITFSRPGCDRVSFDDMYVAAPLGQSLYSPDSAYWLWSSDAWDGPPTNGYGGGLPYVPEDDEWAYWPHISPTGCGAGWFNHLWFKTTLYIEDINQISNVLLVGKYIPNNRIMINDNNMFT
jgi:hypothetical protein